MKAVHRRIRTNRSTSNPSTAGRVHRRGVAAVEFALVAPIFLMLVIGFIELGRALMVQQVLTNASRVGARTAVTLNADDEDVISTTTGYASQLATPNVTVVVDPSASSAAAGDIVNVTVSVPFTEVSWMPAPWFLSNVTLTATSAMRKEGFN